MDILGFGIYVASGYGALQYGAFQQSDYHRMEAAALRNKFPHYDQSALRPVIAQWSEWEQQTRNPAWR